MRISYGLLHTELRASLSAEGRRTRIQGLWILAVGAVLLPAFSGASPSELIVLVHGWSPALLFVLGTFQYAALRRSGLVGLAQVYPRALIRILQERFLLCIGWVAATFLFVILPLSLVIAASLGGGAWMLAGRAAVAWFLASVVSTAVGFSVGVLLRLQNLLKAALVGTSLGVIYLSWGLLPWAEMSGRLLHPAKTQIASVSPFHASYALFAGDAQLAVSASLATVGFAILLGAAAQASLRINRHAPSLVALAIVAAVGLGAIAAAQLAPIPRAPEDSAEQEMPIGGMGFTVELRTMSGSELRAMDAGDVVNAVLVLTPHPQVEEPSVRAVEVEIGQAVRDLGGLRTVHAVLSTSEVSVYRDPTTPSGWVASPVEVNLRAYPHVRGDAASTILLIRLSSGQETSVVTHALTVHAKPSALPSVAAAALITLIAGGALLIGRSPPSLAGASRPRREVERFPSRAAASARHEMRTSAEIMEDGHARHRD